MNKNRINRFIKIVRATPEIIYYISIYNNAYELCLDRPGFRVNQSVEEIQKLFDFVKEVIYG